jgi:hypothetical protein
MASGPGSAAVSAAAQAPLPWGWLASRPAWEPAPPVAQLPVEAPALAVVAHHLRNRPG